VPENLSLGARDKTWLQEDSSLSLSNNERGLEFCFWPSQMDLVTLTSRFNDF